MNQDIYYQHDKPCRYCKTFTRYVGLNSCVKCVEKKLEKALAVEEKNKCPKKE